MQKTAEAVSLGHPDKTADYISSYLLDRMIEQDARVRYAVEVMIKDNTVILGGEVQGCLDLSHLNQFVIQALSEIGYTQTYADRWGECTINPKKIKVINLIGYQSADIAQGVEQNGWGDQGVFVGYACQGEGYLNKELYLAKKLNRHLYEKALQSADLGLDIKTQITLDDAGAVQTAIVAIPMLRDIDLTPDIVRALGETPRQIIVNGTGRYTFHSAIADCGITGRKLACDFYSTACPIGGGSPWTKDASKADVTLNLYARQLAVQYLTDNDECFVYLSSCIGRSELPSAVVKTVKNGIVSTQSVQINKKPVEIIDELDLNRPAFADLCRQMTYGIF